MKKTYFTLFLIAVTVLTGMSFVYAEDHSQHKSMQMAGDNQSAQNPNASEPSNVVNVSNEICPISGEKIDPKSKATYEYKGKTYNFCCASCIDEFKKDPEKYIKKIEGQKAVNQ